MIAKLRIRSSTNIAAASSHTSAPSQLVAPDLEVRMRGAYQCHRVLTAPHPQRVIAGHARTLLTVHGEHRAALIAFDPDFDFEGIWQDHRPVAQSVRTNWRQHHDVERREDYGPAGAQCICRRASGCCDDQSVGTIRAEALAICG